MIMPMALDSFNQTLQTFRDASSFRPFTAVCMN
jgi:hypothetical protein